MIVRQAGTAISRVIPETCSNCSVLNILEMVRLPRSLHTSIEYLIQLKIAEIGNVIFNLSLISVVVVD